MTTPLPLEEWTRIAQAATPGVQTGDELYQDCPHITPDTRLWLDTFTPAAVLRLLALVAEYHAAQVHNLAQGELMRTQRTALQRQVARLKKYGQHLDACRGVPELVGGYPNVLSGKCTCGLKSALAPEPETPR